MKKYEILEHKADLKIRAFGKDLKELFKNAMFGMQQALEAEIKNQKSPKQSLWDATGQAKIKKKIKIKSNDLPSLLVDFLSEINYLNEVNREVYSDLKFTKFSKTKLEGEISGNKVESFGLIIKGVTYHNLEVKQKKDKTWEARVLFDI